MANVVTGFLGGTLALLLASDNFLVPLFDDNGAEFLNFDSKVMSSQGFSVSMHSRWRRQTKIK